MIDPHMHMWSLVGDHYPVLRPNRGAPKLDKIRVDYLVEDYLNDAQGQGIAGTVHVEALSDSPLWETEWLNSLDKSSGVANRYVAGAPFGSDETAGILERQAECDRVVAVRQVIAWHPARTKSPNPAPGLALEPTWRDGAAQAARLGLSLELVMFPWQAEDVVDLAMTMPELQLIVNHCASPIERSSADLAEWRKNIEAMATCPNVTVKIAGLGHYDPAPSVESFRMIIDPVAQSFGPHRAMFASDYPPEGMHMEFAHIYRLFREVAASYGPQEQRSMFFDTARTLYRMDVPS
ncbi:amidohydrolase family protein [Streptomyces sp. NPDC048430]|uniref:amidohydrolase family protein n=1 Tax=Streptomyces sp. NPDC048430 TaxID=3155388 RepID=UPI00343C331A